MANRWISAEYGSDIGNKGVFMSSESEDLAVVVDQRMVLKFFADLPYYVHEGEAGIAAADDVNSDTYKLRSSLRPIAFTCDEAINQCYTLEVVVAVDSAYADLAEKFLMQAFALRVEWRENDVRGLGDKFQIEKEGGERFSNGRSRNFSGRVAECEYLGDSFVSQGTRPVSSFYRFVVRPSFWFMAGASRIRTFLKKDVKSILKEVLDTYGKEKMGGDIYDSSDQVQQSNPGEFMVEYDFDSLESADQVSDSALQALFDPRRFVMQYEETDLDFFTRWIERQGWHYYFDFPMVEADENGMLSRYREELLVVASKNTLKKTGGGDDDFLRRAFEAESQIGLQTFASKSNSIPGQVTVHDHNPLNPSHKLVCTYPASPREGGLPGVVLENEFFESEGEGSAVAKCRMEGYECRKTSFAGSSNLPAMTPGHSYYKYYSGADAGTWANDAHTIVSVKHRGQLAHPEEQTALAILGVEAPAVGYANTFSSVKFALPFRPVVTRTRAKITASARGWILPLDDKGATATNGGYYYVRIMGVEPPNAKAQESGSAGPMPSLALSGGYKTGATSAYPPAPKL